ncbi:MAG: PA2779 family protein [Gammaproteobacteria bacterium]|jgi:hypothetical protein
MQRMQRPLTWLLCTLLAILPVVPLQAAMIGSEQIIDPPPSRPAQEPLQRLLDRTAVRQQLQAWGVSPDLARERISRLSDAELARINQDIENLNAGGESVLGVILIVFIVFVITDVIGATDIFPFIHPVR